MKIGETLGMDVAAIWEEPDIKAHFVHVSDEPVAIDEMETDLVVNMKCGRSHVQVALPFKTSEELRKFASFIMGEAQRWDEWTARVKEMKGED